MFIKLELFAARRLEAATLCIDSGWTSKSRFLQNAPQLVMDNVSSP